MKKIMLRKNEHQYVTKRLSAWIDGTLSEGERTRVQAHLQGCEACRQELESLLWVKRLLRQTPTVPVPRSFVLRPADLERSSARVRWQSPVAIRWATAVVSLLFVVVLLGDLLSAPLMTGRLGVAAPVEQEATMRQANVHKPEFTVTTGEVTQEVERVQETVVVEKEVVVTVVVEETAPTAAQRMMPTSSDAEATPTVAPKMMIPPPDTGATVEATAPADEQPVSLMAVEATPAEENLGVTSEADSQQAVSEPTRGESLPEETPVPQTMEWESTRAPARPPSRLPWRIAEVGLGVALVVLVVLWVVVRKRI